MEKSKFNIKVNLTYGLIVIIPVAVIVIVFAKLVEILDIIAKSIGLDTTFGAAVAIIFALIFSLLICYGVGLLVNTQLGAWSFEKFEKVLSQIPGYTIISSVMKGFVLDKIEEYRPVLIQVGAPGTSMMGFVMEENENGTLTVFVPNTPVMTVGNLYIVQRDNVTFLETTHLKIVSCITEWGIGSNKLFGESGSHENKIEKDTSIISNEK